MKIINNFKQGLIHGFGILTILGVAGIAYAAITPITEVTIGTTLQAAEYNKLVQKLNRIDEKAIATAWVNFDGTNCTINGNECGIRDSFNINRVVRNSLGDYYIYFENNTSDINYSVTFGAPNGVINDDSYFDGSQQIGEITISSFRYRTGYRQYNTRGTRDNPIANIQVFGGKN